MESFGFDLDLDLVPQLNPPSVDLPPLFSDEEIGDIDEWWQELFLPPPSSLAPVEQLLSPADASSPAETVTSAVPSSSFSSHTPATSDRDVVVAPSSSGTKRSAPSSPECEQDEPKRARRLERNREAASQSRARKKSYMKELEVKCRTLEAHVAQLQQAMAVTSMENSMLKDELVRVKKPKENSVKSGVAEPAVLESNSLPSEFLRHLSYHCPMAHHPTSRTAYQFQGFLLALLQLLILAALSGSSDQHPSLPQPLSADRPYVPVGMEVNRAFEGMAGRGILRRKKSRHQFDSNFRRAKRSSEWRVLGRKRRKVKHLRSSRIL